MESAWDSESSLIKISLVKGREKFILGKRKVVEKVLLSVSFLVSIRLS